jgi:hypothetical protein
MAANNVTNDFNLTRTSTNDAATLLRGPRKLWDLLRDDPTGYCECIHFVYHHLPLLYGTEVSTKVHDLLRICLNHHTMNYGLLTYFFTYNSDCSLSVLQYANIDLNGIIRSTTLDSQFICANWVDEDLSESNLKRDV